jgi:hypothetical protein
MRIYYLGSTVFVPQHIADLRKRSLFVKPAAEKREAYIFQMLNELVSNKHGLTFISSAHGKERGYQPLRNYRKKNINYLYLGYYGSGLLRHLTSYFLSFFRLFALIKSNDIVITYNFPPIYAIPLLILKKLRSYSLIIEYEDFFNADDKRSYIFGPFERMGMHRADAFVASSIGMESTIKSKNLCSPIVVNSGYPSSRGRDFEDENNGLPPHKLFYSGSLDKERGIENLVRTFKSNNSRDYSLTITGVGPLEQFVESEIKHDNRIQYLGMLNEEDYLSQLEQVDICVNSQWSNIDVNFPSKITMYLANGNVVMSTKIYSIINSPFAKLIEFYDENDDTEFWSIVKRITESNTYQLANTASRVDQFNDIMDIQRIKFFELVNRYFTPPRCS